MNNLFYFIFILSDEEKIRLHYIFWELSFYLVAFLHTGVNCPHLKERNDYYSEVAFPGQHVFVHQPVVSQRSRVTVLNKRNTDASSHSPSLLTPKSRGFPGSGNRKASTVPLWKGSYSWECKSVYFGSVLSSEPQTVPRCSDLSGWKPSSGWAAAPRCRSPLCGPVTQGLCLRGGSIVNLLLDTLSGRSVRRDNRPLAVFRPGAAVCGDLWWIEA